MEGGGGDVELATKTLQLEHKLFYLDLKENPRGRYLKISEKTSATRSTIIVPADGVLWFIDLLDYFITTDERDACSQELKIDTKLFYFHIGENKRGRFLKISEASISRNRSTIIVPAGISDDEGWVAFRNVLLEISNETSRPFVAANLQHVASSVHHPGLSDDVGAGFIPSHSSQLASGSDLNVDRLVDLQPKDEVGGSVVSKLIRVDQKRFFFDLGSNNRGHFLRISEVIGADRSSIILPLSGLNQFHKVIGHFLDISKDKLEGMAGGNMVPGEASQDDQFT